MKKEKRPPLDFAADVTGPASRDPERASTAEVPIPNPQPPRATAELPFGVRHAFWWAVLVPLFWGAGLVAFVLGFESPFGVLRLTSVQLAILAALSLTPIGVALFAAYIVQQGARLAAEARRTRALADSMASPALLAAVDAGRAAADVTLQVEAARDAAAGARRELSALRTALAAESEQLTERADHAARSAERLREILAAERESFEAATARMDQQVARVTDAVDRQARVVGEASDLAQAQINEAEAALAARAADLHTAALSASEAGRIAADDLARLMQQLDSIGVALRLQIAKVESTLNERQEQLRETAAAFRNSQERLLVEADARSATLAQSLTRAQADAATITTQAGAAGEKLEQLLAGAAAQLAALTTTAEAQRAELDAAAEAALDRLALSVAEHRRALESEASGATAAIAQGAGEALEAAERYADSARARLDALRDAASEAEGVSQAALNARVEGARRMHDQLAEIAFTAARQADEAMEARLASARQLVERSSTLMDDAGQRAELRIEAGLTAARSSLAEFQRSLDDVDRRLELAPAELDARSAELRAVLERGAAELVNTARRAADETQAIDAAFQERIRRNYEMLSQAVTLMGVVAGRAAPPEPKAPDVQPAPAASPSDADPFSPTVENAAGPDPLLRPRLRLTPDPADALSAPEAEPELATDQEFQAIFEAASGAPPTAPALGGSKLDDGWTWKELLSTMDEAPLDDDALLERLIGELEAMGVDAAALLPRARVEEIAAALASGGADAARSVVSRSAPSAVRRLSRRISTDKALASQVDRFVARYRGVLADARRGSRGDLAATALLGSDPGRAYLLLDAAVAEAEGV